MKPNLTGRLLPALWALAFLQFAACVKADVVATRPVVQSYAEGSNMGARIDGILAVPIAQVSRALADQQTLCAVLLLHINNAKCDIGKGQGADHLVLAVVRQPEDEPSAGNSLDFAVTIDDETAKHFSMALSAVHGPFGTTNHHIVIEAVELAPGNTRLHLAYTYNQSLVTRMASNLYFSTLGKNKVGFTELDSPGDHPKLIGGTRGLLERNLMRYFLAVQAATELPGDPRESSLQLKRWEKYFRLTDQYPAQLHEVSFERYLAAKQKVMRAASHDAPPRPAEDTSAH